MSDDQQIRRSNLRLLRDRKGLGPTQLHEQLGSRYSYWRDLLSDDAKPFGEKAARRIEEGLSLPRGWLDEPQDKPPHVRGAGGKRDKVPSGVAGVTNSVSSFGAGHSGLIGIPLMNVDASMGAGLMLPEHDEVITRMEISQQWLRRHASFSAPENLALITGIGDSMQPTFSDGDVLMVDRGVTDIKVDAVYVLALRDELYIKRVQRRPDGSVLMLSDNRAYEPYMIANGDKDRFAVLGRVVMAWNAHRL